MADARENRSNNLHAVPNTQRTENRWRVASLPGFQQITVADHPALVVGGGGVTKDKRFWIQTSGKGDVGENQLSKAAKLVMDVISKPTRGPGLAENEFALFRCILFYN